MAFIRFTPLAAVLAFSLAHCAPVAEPLLSELSNTSYGPIPGQSPLYSTYSGTAPPFPGNITGAIVNTTAGPPGEDDLLFQNLLSAEWVIFSFYQQGVERFNSTDFIEAGLPNTTYERIQQIRDNEAGHLRIFQDQISTNSVKPGPCQYVYPFEDPISYIALQTVIEISSMAFLTGLELQAKLTLSKAALVAIAATESRHNTWSLIDNWKSTPFAGPADTVYPYANQILDFTNEWVVNGSCPLENPIYPTPRQNLPQITPGAGTTAITPGSTIVFNFTQPDNQPHFTPDQDYYAVFFHGVYNISVPFNTTTYSAVIPPQIEPLGIIIAVVADEEGAPTKESVLAGTLILPQSPAALAASGV
ncbi:uncharacterized protein PV07_09599 [Cladophialophora immunda]|uniref:Protein rds1 n=1 Tax=Cladophialophora immunda TaxID=569365 RepID=A0A0D2CSH5_9EURO|nr:uncharacterized protein PV07_09599 [Cladophialophora immunda]KIW26509.1 hypothetical protein PV07_09599 [Cladophialophora immunda]OQV01181.1 Ferritin-like domain-containing protein [Cladophialophora immunda]